MKGALRQLSLRFSESGRNVMRWLFTDTSSLRGSAGLLLLRVVMGAAFVLHGWPKIHNPMSWMPGDQFPGFLQALAAVAEFGGGIALILGLLTPVAVLGLAGTMAVAVFVVHVPAGDPFVAQGGRSYELAAVYLACSLAVLLLGPGRFSVDSCLFGACAMKSCATKGQPASAV
jgi:putative oxidoreductase